MTPQPLHSSRLLHRLLLATCLLAAGAAQAAPYHGERVTVRQPDGTPVEVVLWGDELFARAETTDGYALVIEPGTNRICYAKAGQDGALVSTGIAYTGDEDAVVDGQRRQRTRPSVDAELRRRGVARGLEHARPHVERLRETARGHLWGGGRAPWNAPASGSTAAQVTAQSAALLAAAPTGSATGLLVLVDFPNRTATIPQAELETAFNGASYGDPRGSIRTWTEAISYGAVSVNHRVTAYYRARNPTTYYLRGGQGDYTGATELMREVYAYIDANIDLRTLTVVNGALSSLAVVYAGDVIANGWANSLWPHAAGARYTTSEGVRITHYYMSNLGSRVPISLKTHRHELGHSFFSWPDTYDYDSDSRSAGGFAMETDIPCAPFRMWAGWINVVDVNGVNQTFTLPANGDTALRYRNPGNTREYFIVENLLKTGWNSAAPDQGLLVWHVDEAGDNSWQDMTPTRHYELSVEQADGLFELERNVRNGADGDLFHAGYKTLFDATTTPNSNWWSGAQSGLRLSNIGAIGSTMSVTVGTGTVTTYALTVAKAGTGAGTVTSSTGGINCGTACAASFTSGTTVTLTATAASGSTFAGWSGACTSTTGTCAVTMTAARAVTATFDTSGGTSYALTVTRTGTGSGTVTSSSGGINCGTTCAASLASGTTVTLTATAASGSTFAGWSGACTSTTGTCAVTMTAARAVTATFDTSGGTSYALTVTRTGTGSGTVTSSSGGINCGTTCAASLASGTTVTLTATAASGSTFAGWSGACTSTTGTCAVTMTAARAVTATFSTSGGTTPCANPSTFTNQSGNFNTAGAVCLRTSATVNGWGCSNFEGRTVRVNDGAATAACGAGPFPLAKWSDGYTYFSVSAGTFPWASLYAW